MAERYGRGVCLCIFHFGKCLIHSHTSIIVLLSPAWQSFMTCNVDTYAEMEAGVPITAVPHFVLDEQPSPLQCQPGKDPAGYWDTTIQMLKENITFFNAYGHSDVKDVVCGVVEQYSLVAL